MNEFMKILLSLSVSGTVLLLLILGLKPLYKNKFSRRWQYYIWIIVVLRFLLPFTPDTTIVGGLFEKIDVTGPMNESHENAHVSDTVNDNGSEIKQTNIKPKTQPDTVDKSRTQSQASTPEWPQIHGYTEKQANENTIDSVVALSFTNIYVPVFTWSALVLVLFVRKITIYQSFIRYIKAGNTEISDIKTLNLLSDCMEKLNIKTKVELSSNAAITSPIMIGFFRPSIVLPAEELGDKELPYVFVHELLHYKKKDIFYKWLVQIVICIHWFNPFVYLLEKEVNKACELSCDEAVIFMLDESARREYGDTLISFMKSNNLNKGSLASVTLTEGAEQLKERLGAIMNFKKKTKLITVSATVFTIVVCFCFLAVGAYAAPSVNNQCDFMVKRGTITEEEKKLVFDIAKNIAFDRNDKDEDDDWDFDWADEFADDDWNFDWADEFADDDWNFDWADEFADDKWDWDWEDKAFLEEYAAYGIEKVGNVFYYQGELVYILKDQRPDSSCYLLDTNSKGTVSIKVVHNEEGKITGISYMTDEEVQELMPKLLGQ